MLEDLIPYQEALILKKLGFNAPCSEYYACPVSELAPVLNPNTVDNPTGLNSLYPHGYEFGYTFAAAPSYGLAFSWLDSEHDLVPADSTLACLQDLLFVLKARVAAAGV